jgi:hypothetical protein
MHIDDCETYIKCMDYTIVLLHRNYWGEDSKNAYRKSSLRLFCMYYTLYASPQLGITVKETHKDKNIKNYKGLRWVGIYSACTIAQLGIITNR